MLEVVLFGGMALFALVLVAAVVGLLWLAVSWGPRARGADVTLVPGPDGVVRLHGQVHDSGRTLAAYADPRNHGTLELRPDVLVWQATDPDRSWYAPYPAITVADVRGAFSMHAGPGLDLDVDGVGTFKVNASDRRINKLSRNDAKSMREAAVAVALARWLGERGARIASGLTPPG